MNCFASVPAETYSAMAKADQEQVCHAEAHAVRQMIQNGVPDFKNVLAERIASLSKVPEPVVADE